MSLVRRFTSDSLNVFLLIDADFFSCSDSSNQANGCDHKPALSSSDDGNTSEEEDDGHSYAEFVKKNHVHLHSASYFCLCWFILYPFFFGIKS
jgi:hypothetical protein